jgi:hypothetical protein
VKEARKDAQAEEDSESESSSEEDDQEDAVMANASEFAPDAAADGQQAMLDTRDKPAGHRSSLSRRQKYGNKTERKRKGRQAATAAIATPELQAQTSGRRRKRKSGGQRGAAPGG